MTSLQLRIVVSWPEALAQGRDLGAVHIAPADLEQSELKAGRQAPHLSARDRSGRKGLVSRKHLAVSVSKHDSLRCE